MKTPIVGVPVQPLQDHYNKMIERGHTGTELARYVGWFDKHGRPDNRRLRRALGIDKYQSHGEWRKNKSMHYKTAVTICKGLGIDYTDVGV